MIGFATLPFARLGTSLGAAALGVLRVLLVTALGAGLCQLLATLIYGEGTTALRERLAEGPAALWMFLAACLAVLMLARTCSALWLGSIGLLLIIGVAAQMFLPGANWLFVWPALVAILLAHVSARIRINSTATLALTAIIGGLVLALVAQLVLVAYVGLGSMTPIVVALIVPFTIALTGPLLIVWTEARWSPRGCVAALVVAMGLAGNFALTDGFSARQPRPGDLFHLSDDAGRSWWATSSSPAELPAGKAARVDIPASSRFKVWGVPAPRLASPRPQFAFASRSGAMKLQITTAQTGRLLLMSLRPSVALADVRINGKPVKLAPGRWTPLGMRAAVPANLVIEGKAAQPGNLEIRYLSAVDSLPSEAPRAAGPPTNWTPLSGGRAVMGTVRFALR